MGYEIALLRDNNCPVPAPDPNDVGFVASVDFSTSQPDELIQVLAGWRERTILLTTIETSVHDHARLTQKYGYPGPTPEAASIALDKFRMRERFARKLPPANTVQFAEINNLDELRTFANRVEFPIVLKPANLFGSMFVSLCRDEHALVEAYQRDCPEVRRLLDKLGKTKTPAKMQAEEFITGRCVSVDVVVSRDGTPYCSPIVDIWTNMDFDQVGFAHIARLVPSSLSTEQQGEAFALAESSVRAIGLANCIAHVEIVVGDNGPKLLEVAARVGGGRNALMERAFGISLIEQYARVLEGHDPEIVHVLSNSVAVISPFPLKAGNYLGSPGIERVKRNCAGLEAVNVRAKVGERVGPAHEGFLPPSSITLTSEARFELETTVRSILSDQDFYSVG